jgi:hypothetical protein
MNQEQALRGGFSLATFARGGEGWDILQSPFSPGHPDRDQYRFELPHLLQIQVRQNGTTRGVYQAGLVVAVLHVQTVCFPNRKMSMSRCPDCAWICPDLEPQCSPEKVRIIAKPAGALECGRHRRMIEILPVKRSASQCLAVSGGCHVAVSVGSPR